MTACDEKDYISITNMVRNVESGLSLIEKWLKNKNTIEFLGIWEEMHNPAIFLIPMNSGELKIWQD
ncbi:MAG: KilA-N domain-containing protein [Endomicrobium sp.]|nr:KilA-N domain-containing protein [Endomicrobium sp.]